MDFALIQKSFHTPKEVRKLHVFATENHRVWVDFREQLEIRNSDKRAKAIVKHRPNRQIIAWLINEHEKFTQREKRQTEHKTLALPKPGKSFPFTHKTKQNKSFSTYRKKRKFKMLINTEKKWNFSSPLIYIPSSPTQKSPFKSHKNWN